MAVGGSGEPGEIGAREAFELLRRDPAAVLVDVRTAAEWTFVGVPDLSELGSEPVLLEWQRYPTMARNADFAAALAAEVQRRGAGPDSPLLFLCRSGARSLAAAQVMAASGYTRCLNVRGGFEGPLDAGRHRGGEDGWKAEHLPWRQS